MASPPSARCLVQDTPGRIKISVNKQIAHGQWRRKTTAVNNAKGGDDDPHVALLKHQR